MGENIFPLSVQIKLSAIVPKSIKELASPIQLELLAKFIAATEAQQVPILSELELVSCKDPEEY